MSFPINPQKKASLMCFCCEFLQSELMSMYLTTQLCAWFKYLPWEPNRVLQLCKCLKSGWNLGGNHFHRSQQSPNQAFCMSSVKSSDQWSLWIILPAPFAEKRINTIPSIWVINTTNPVKVWKIFRVAPEWDARLFKRQRSWFETLNWCDGPCVHACHKDDITSYVCHISTQWFQKRKKTHYA